MSTLVMKRHRQRAKIFNLPNLLTGARLILAVVMFVLIGTEHYLASTVLFVIAASTDWLDGYYARKYGQVTTFGRILDPFADKVIICGTFILVSAIPQMWATPGGLRSWMVVVLVGRELLVTALRSFIEERGGDFSANLSGKLKMVFQCVAASVCLFYLDYPVRAPMGAWQVPSQAPAWVWYLMVVSIWSTLAITIYSGLIYIFVAMRLLRRH
jgi:CDP-diacylglycerol--glycerol-3-phosphate 3-phosphatidyltransferase